VNVFAIRHGETKWSLSGQHTGTTDIALTDNGRRVAERMRPLLAANPFRLVFCSPMRRARETCELAGLGENAVIDCDLNEWNYGEYEGVTPEQIHEMAPGWFLFQDGCPGGESPEQVGARVDRVIARIRRGRGRYRALRARTRVSGARSALDRATPCWGATFSAQHGYPVRPRLLPGNTRRAHLEWDPHQLGCRYWADQKLEHE
jgi:broad specificity phosphatase PhoE